MFKAEETTNLAKVHSLARWTSERRGSRERVKAAGVRGWVAGWVVDRGGGAEGK